MRTITLKILIEQIRQYIDGKCEYDAVREYVFSPHESEDEIEVADDADQVLSVLLPYMLSEEAFGDKMRDVRLRRLVRLFENPRETHLSAVVVFALEYDEIQELEKKLDSDVISEAVFREQLRKLSPATFDIDSIVSWGISHKGLSEIKPTLVG